MMDVVIIALLGVVVGITFGMMIQEEIDKCKYRKRDYDPENYLYKH